MARARFVNLLIAVAPMLATSCSGGPEPPPPMTLFAAPVDGTTAVAALSVELGTGTGLPNRQILVPLIADTKLWTWPDLAPLATISSGAAALDGLRMNTGVSFTASQQVPEGWYALILAGVTSTTQLGLGQFHFLRDGRPAVRVHVGSAPLMWGVAVCPTLGDVTSVVVRFSEIVHAATTSAMPLSVTAGPAGAAKSCAAFQVPLVDQPQRDFAYDCPTIGLTDSVTVAVTAGLVSETGVDVPVSERSFGADAFTLDGVIDRCPSLKVDP